LIEQIVEERVDSLCHTRGYHERDKLSCFPIVPQVKIATAAVVSTSTTSAAHVALRILCKFCSLMLENAAKRRWKARYEGKLAS
jgi:hypothetical protein